MEQLNKGDLFENIITEYGEMLCGAKKRHEFGDPNKGRRAERAGSAKRRWSSIEI